MTNLPSFDLIVIGGGPAGATAALRGRELGASVALIER
ncbi:MAG: FAD-dependent oxidoreductase, partial [Anaerolineae bacterium]|nr:FAD-dependent oxidoreductase [Anaerolineae bacterium]